MRIAANEAAKLLGVAVGTTGKELKTALRRKIRENHPDVVKDDGTRLQKVREAYAILDADNVPSNWNLEDFEPHNQARASRQARQARPPNVGSWASPSAQRKAAEMEEERRRKNEAARTSAADRGRRQANMNELKRQGFFQNLMNEQMDNQVFQSSRPGQKAPTATMDWYRAMTNIRVRAEPDIQSPALGTVIRQGETIKVNAELVENGQKFLKLKDQDGWVFQRGISGEWEGRQILVRF
jgi:curved DNA-binding protein CbpA